MARCRVDQSLDRVEMNGFAFPLGVYPVDAIEPRQGYTMAFEPADDGSSTAEGEEFGASERGEGSERPAGPMGRGRKKDEEEDEGEGVADPLAAGGEDDDEEGEEAAGGEAEWEEWPDRYVFDILVPATRLETLVRSLLSLLPGRIYPILDFLGQDEWREVDPYVSYDLLGMDRFLEALRRFRGFFYEDGLVGFGAMSDEPFLYVFVDEHKVVTVRAETRLREKVEGVLGAFDLEQVEEILSADSATHEHRTVLESPDDRPDLLSAEEIVEELRDEWRLVLNIDPESNVDEEGKDLGITGWRCIVRYDPPVPEPAAPPSKGSGKGAKGKKKAQEEDDEEEAPERPALGPTPTAPPSRYAEVFLTAESLTRASELTLEALEDLLVEAGVDLDEDELSDPVLVQQDRWGADDFAKAVEKATGQRPDMKVSKVAFRVWLN
jgi:hypothetical protein